MRLAWCACVLVAVVGSACLEAPGVPCGDRICPPGSTCDVENGRCLVIDTACEGKADGEPCDHVSGGIGYCDRDACYLPVCGDGSVAPSTEECEGETAEVTCGDLGFYAGDSVACSACRFETSACIGRCGDGEIQDQFDESCEGATPPVGSCLDYGFERGHLSCTVCRPGFARCGEIGWIDASSNTPLDFTVAISVGNDLYAAGADFDTREAALLRRVGGGWSVVKAWPFPTGRIVHVTGLFAVSASDIWVVGYHTTNPASSYVGLIYHFDGSTWTEETVANLELVDVWASGPDDVYIAGTNHQSGLSIQVRRGTTGSWTVSALGTGEAEALWGTSATDVYLATQGGARHWNGTAWSTFQSGSIPALRDVHGFAPDEVYFLTNGSGVLRWNGLALASIGGPSPAGPSARLDGTAASGLVAVLGSRVHRRGISEWVDITGELGLGDAAAATARVDQLFVLGDDGGARRYAGSVWVPLAVTGLPRPITDGWITDSNTFFVVDAFAAWQRQSDGTWQDLGVTSAGRAPVAIWGVGDLVIVATFGSDTPSPTSKLHYVGASLPALSIVDHIGGIGGTSATDIYVTGNDPGGAGTEDPPEGIAQHYNGSAWSVMSVPAGSGRIVAPACRGTGECFAIDLGRLASPPRILRTAGAGAPWTVEDTGSADVSDLTALWANDTDVWAVGRTGKIVRKTASGWSAVESGTATHLVSVVGISSSDVFISGVQGALYHYDGTAIERVRPRVGVQDVVASVLARVGANVALGGFVAPGGGSLPFLDVLERTTPW